VKVYSLPHGNQKSRFDPTSTGCQGGCEYQTTASLNSFPGTKKAPVEFIAAIACLLQDDIADKAMEILKER